MTTTPAGLIPEWTRGDRLRKARELTGMTTRQFAEHIGVSQKTISDAENDKRQMRKLLLNAWALGSGVPAMWLESGATPAGPNNGPDEGLTLPRLDSNQQPSVLTFPQVRRLLIAAPLQGAAA